MGKYNISMRKYSNEIKIEVFYEYLCSDVVDDIESIREMYKYYLSFIRRYKYVMYEYDTNYDFSDQNGWTARAFLEKEHKKYEMMIRLTHDSYLAVLLHKLDYEKYVNIIKGLYCYFEYCDAINPPLKNTNYKNKEYTLTKDEYLKGLISSQLESTGVGTYLYTSSLGSIIEIEKEIIKPDQKIKCLCVYQPISYGDLKVFE